MKRPVHYWMVAAAVLIAVSLMVISAIFWGPKIGQEAASAPVDVGRELECTTIKREFDVWIGSYTDLTMLLNARSVEAEHHSERLKSASDTFYKATQGYDDMYSKELAVAVAGHRVELARLRTFLVATGEFPADAYDKTASTWHAVRPAYEQFEKYQC
jgi:hypothetical protein